MRAVPVIEGTVEKMRPRLSVAIVALTLLSACSGNGTDDDAAGVPPRPTGVSAPAPSPSDAPTDDTSSTVSPSLPVPVARTLVALGDSFASGIGASGPIVECGRSAGGWTGLLALELGMDFVNLACSGATLTDTIEQVPQVPADADVVAITAGGNTLKFSQVVVLCLAGECEKGWDTAMANLSRVRPETERLLEDVHRAAPGVSAIAIMLYPSATRPGLTCGPVTTEVSQLFAQGADLLNAEIVAAAGDAAARGIPVIVVTPDRFVDHALCADAPWFHDFERGLLVMHPNDAGHAAIASAAKDALLSGDR